MTDVLAVDGGQSTIRLQHSAGTTVIEVDGVSRHHPDVVAAVVASIGEGWRRLGTPNVRRAMLGLTTAPADPGSADRLCALVSDTTGAEEVWLADDAVTSGIGALSGQPGVSITAGTGVACLAVPEHGAPRVIGGHGYLLGDEGGAFWIGRRGLSAVLRAVELRAPATALTERASQRFGDLADLHVRIYDTPRAVDDVARFATDVLEAAAERDAVASAIVDDAALELANLALAGTAWVGGAEVDVALGGRLLTGPSELRVLVDRLLQTNVPHARPRTADSSPLHGAMALGRQAEAGRWTSLVHTWSVAPSS
jgi:N-acetylglucosamine kinase-like BadF-type ATPase